MALTLSFIEFSAPFIKNHLSTGLSSGMLKSRRYGPGSSTVVIHRSLPCRAARRYRPPYPRPSVRVTNCHPSNGKVSQISNARVMKYDLVQSGDPGINARRCMCRVELPRAIILIMGDDQNRLASFDNVTGCINCRAGRIAKGHCLPVWFLIDMTSPVANRSPSSTGNNTIASAK